MKILRITTEINRGSIGRTTEQISNLVLDEGWESYIGYGRTSGTSTSNVIKIGNKLSVYQHVFLTRIFDKHGYGSKRATERFVDKIKKIKPDIIHLHDIHGYYINLKLLFDFLKESKIPVVWTQHDCWSYTGHCAHYTRVGCYKWEKECYECPQKLSYPKSIFWDGSNRNFKLKKELFTSLENIYIVAVSNWLENELKRSFLNVYPIRTIYNGVDTEVFYPKPEISTYIREKYKLGNKKLLMAFATAWSSAKGLNDYYKLINMLNDEYSIVLVGLPKSLHANLSKGIIGVERIDNVEELVNLYSSASIVLNLSNEESFGKTTVEGLACGIPGIVYNSTASPELIDNKTGCVVESGNINDVVKAIHHIMSWNIDETVKNCRNRALNLFDMKKNFNQYIELYKNILKIEL